MVSVEYKEAITEVLDILYNSDEDLLGKIPQKLIEFWERNKSNTYKPNLNHDLPLSEMNLKNKTKSIIAMIYLNYICEDDEKKSLKHILKNNEDFYQQELREKYNPDNLFKNKETKIETVENTVSMVEYKDSIFTKIKNWFKRVI